jgi:hypothetical protein
MKSGPHNPPSAPYFATLPVPDRLRRGRAVPADGYCGNVTVSVTETSQDEDVGGGGMGNGEAVGDEGAVVMADVYAYISVTRFFISRSCQYDIRMIFLNFRPPIRPARSSLLISLAISMLTGVWLIFNLK